MITIDGKPAPTALVSVPELARRSNIDERLATRLLRRGGVELVPHAGTAWASASAPPVADLLARAGLGSSELFTARGAAELGTRPAAVRAALTGTRSLFSTGLHEPVALGDDLRRANALRVKQAVGASAGVGGAAGRTAFTVARAVAPYALGAVPTVVLATKLARSIGDELESMQERRTRRTGMLLGAGIVATGGGWSVAHSLGRELPQVARLARGVAVGGAALGVLGLAGSRSSSMQEAG